MTGLVTWISVMISTCSCLRPLPCLVAFYFSSPFKSVWPRNNKIKTTVISLCPHFAIQTHVGSGTSTEVLRLTCIPLVPIKKHV